MRTTNVTATMQFTAQTATHQRIFVYHNQRGRRTTTTKRRDTREAQVTIITEDCARRVVTKTIYMTDTKHRAVFLRQHSYLSVHRDGSIHNNAKQNSLSWPTVSLGACSRPSVSGHMILSNLLRPETYLSAGTCCTASHLSNSAVQTQKCMAVDWRTLIIRSTDLDPPCRGVYRHAPSHQ